MIEPAPPGDPGGEGEDGRVIVVVVRSGGILGRSKRWVAEPDEAETDHWVTLIERCPWDDPAEQDAGVDPPHGADRYLWSIRATFPGERRRQELPDTALDGPWRELVDAVRDTPGTRSGFEPSPRPGHAPVDPESTGPRRTGPE